MRHLLAASALVLSGCVCDSSLPSVESPDHEKRADAEVIGSCGATGSTSHVAISVWPYYQYGAIAGVKGWVPTRMRWKSNDELVLELDETRFHGFEWQKHKVRDLAITYVFVRDDGQPLSNSRTTLP